LVFSLLWIEIGEENSSIYIRYRNIVETNRLVLFSDSYVALATPLSHN